MPPSTITATERLYLTADRKRVVPAGHKDAATLYATPGTRIPMSAVEKFGLNEKGLPKKGGGSASAKASADEKSGQEGGNKQGDKGADKSGQKGGNKGASKPGLTVKKAAKKAAAQGASGS